jgi:phosphonate transport system permease protein
MTSGQTAPAAGPIPGPPTRPLTSRLVDYLVWGGVAVLLANSFGAVDMGHFTAVFTKSQNMQSAAQGFLRPDFTHWGLFIDKMWLTVQIALWGTFLAVIIAIPFGLACARNLSPIWLQQPMRLLMNAVRSVPDLVIAYLFISAVGLGPFAGVMAFAINTGGVLAKLFSEAVESIDPQPVEGVRATGASSLQEIAWGVLPQVAPHWTSYALYRFESNARSATVLGLIGAGGIGQVLFESLNSYKYSETAAIVIVIGVAVSLIDLLSQAIRSRLL